MTSELLLRRDGSVVRPTFSLAHIRCWAVGSHDCYGADVYALCHRCKLWVRQ